MKDKSALLGNARMGYYGCRQMLAGNVVYSMASSVMLIRPLPSV